LNSKTGAALIEAAPVFVSWKVWCEFFAAVEAGEGLNSFQSERESLEITSRIGKLIPASCRFTSYFHFDYDSRHQESA
jgi:hypothetical protein